MPIFISKVRWMAAQWWHWTDSFFPAPCMAWVGDSLVFAGLFMNCINCKPIILTNL